MTHPIGSREEWEELRKALEGYTDEQILQLIYPNAAARRVRLCGVASKVALRSAFLTAALPVWALGKTFGVCSRLLAGAVERSGHWFDTRVVGGVCSWHDRRYLAAVGCETEEEAWGEILARARLVGSGVLEPGPACRCSVEREEARR